MSLQLHIVGVLHVVWLFVGLAVEVDDTVFDLQCLAGQTYAALHVVLATVGGTGGNTSKLVAVLFYVAASQLLYLVIES